METSDFLRALTAKICDDELLHQFAGFMLALGGPLAQLPMDRRTVCWALIYLTEWHDGIAPKALLLCGAEFDRLRTDFVDSSCAEYTVMGVPIRQKLEAQMTVKDEIARAILLNEIVTAISVVECLKQKAVSFAIFIPALEKARAELVTSLDYFAQK